MEEASKLPGIQQISIIHGVGEKVTEVNSSGARMGFVIAQDINVDKAIEDCKAALDRIQISIKSEVCLKK